MRSAKLVRWLLIAALALLALGACGDDDDDTDASGSGDTSATTTASTEAPGGTKLISILSPASGAEFGGNTVTLDVEAPGFSVVKADGDRSGNTGHFHVFIDRDPVAAGAVIPKEPGILHTTDDPIVVTGLAPGSHRLTVVLGNGAHERIGSGEAVTEVKLTGPSVKASAPATMAAGQPVTVTVAAEGLTLVKADGDISGKTGHLHLFVDTPPTPAGEPIPTGNPKIIHTAETSVAVTDLAAGEHTIWVVAGNGAHVPLDPPVKDKVTVTVS